MSDLRLLLSHSCATQIIVSHPGVASLLDTMPELLAKSAESNSEVSFRWQTTSS